MAENVDIHQPPAPEVFVGPDQRQHVMRYTLEQGPLGVVAGAEEENAEAGSGYRFQVAGDLDQDIADLFRTLRDRVEDGISELWLQPNPDGEGWAMREGRVRGRFVQGSAGEPPDVVIDGRRLTWSELQRAIGPVDGLEFRLAMGDEDEDLDDVEAYHAAHVQAQEESLRYLRDALPSLRSVEPPVELAEWAERIREGMEQGDWPFEWMRRAADWAQELPADDLELWLGAAGGAISPREITGLEEEAEASLVSLEPFDWMASILGLVQGGVGSSADPARLIEHLDAALADIDEEIDTDDEPVLGMAFETILPAWEAVGAVDENSRLTPLGRWGLPRALAWAWSQQF